MYTSLSPCDMCTGACLLYKVARVVIGENATFVGGEDYLKAKGVEVVVLQNDECKDLMARFIAAQPHVWCVLAGSCLLSRCFCLTCCLGTRTSASNNHSLPAPWSQSTSSYTDAPPQRRTSDRPD